MEPTIADVLQQYAAAFAEDHQRAAADFYTDDVMLRVPGRHPFAGEFRGLRERCLGLSIASTDGDRLRAGCNGFEQRGFPRPIFTGEERHR